MIGYFGAFVILFVGIATGIGLLLLFDMSFSEDPNLRAGKRLNRVARRIGAATTERAQLEAKYMKAKYAIHRLKKSITGHVDEIDTLERLYSEDPAELSSTKRVDADSVIVFGRGREWVYLYTFAVQEQLAKERKQPHYPMKLGMSTQSNVVTRVDQQVAGNTTAIAERAILRVAFRVNDSDKMEAWMHKKLAHMGRKVQDSIGIEWYNTNPTEVEQLFRSYVLKFSRMKKPVAR
ncbi:MAG: GIY-YIG nuclease family protein [Planctomycetaceae bacterium]